LVITITATNELVAFDAATGKQAWLRPLTGGGAQRRASATYVNGRLFLADGSDLLGVDAASGNILWRKSLGAAPSANPAVLHGRIYVGLADKRLVSVAPGDGMLLHSIALPRPAASAPAAIGNSIVVLAGESEIVAADAELSKILWRRAAGGEWTVPRIEAWNDVAVVGDSRGSVILLDPATGNPARSFHVEGRPRGIAVTPDVLYVGTYEGDVFSIRPGHAVGDVPRGDGAGHGQ
jgi:outer membrane protein assembly factor BamB